MNIGDVVVFRQTGVPPVGVGEVVGFTEKRVRVAKRYGNGYVTILRARHNLKIEYKRRKFV